MAERVKQNQRAGQRPSATEARRVGKAINDLTQRIRGPRDLTGGKTSDPNRQRERGPGSPNSPEGEPIPFTSSRWDSIGASVETVTIESATDPSVFVKVKRFRQVRFLLEDGTLVVLDIRNVLSLLDP